MEVAARTHECLLAPLLPLPCRISASPVQDYRQLAPCEPRRPGNVPSTCSCRPSGQDQCLMSPKAHTHTHIHTHVYIYQQLLQPPAAALMLQSMHLLRRANMLLSLHLLHRARSSSAPAQRGPPDACRQHEAAAGAGESAGTAA
eukprot:scaffold150789_cov18-Tisochrysis_lutea.AAC.1